MNDDKNKQLFLSLIYSFQMQTMMQLGKLTNPVTNKTEIELDGAQVTIDMLDMLKAKTKNNNSEEEIKFLDQVLADLKLNFVEERNKEEAALLKGDDKEKISSQKDAEKESSSSDKTSPSGESENKEKPLTEQMKDYENPLPPQE